MITKKIAYTDLDGNQREGDFAFNLSQQDFVRFELRYDPGRDVPEKDKMDENGVKVPHIQLAYQKLVNSNDLEGAYDLLADLIVTAYGVREGDSFVKNRRVNGRDTRPDLGNFLYHPAFEQLMVDLMTNTDTLLGFFKNLTNVALSDEAYAKMAEAIKAAEAGELALVEADRGDEPKQ